MGFQVYFSSKEVGNTLVLAVSVFEGVEAFPEVVKERKKLPGTFYENEIAAFKLALETVLNEGYDDVTLYNQNKLLFEWLSKPSHDNKLRDTFYQQIRELFSEIVNENETSISYKVVKGNKNEAKKFLTKYAKGMDEEQDLTSLFMKNNKVVSFNKKAK